MMMMMIFFFIYLAFPFCFVTHSSSSYPTNEPHTDPSTGAWNRPPPININTINKQQQKKNKSWSSQQCLQLHLVTPRKMELLCGGESLGTLFLVLLTLATLPPLLLVLLPVVFWLFCEVLAMKAREKNDKKRELGTWVYEYDRVLKWKGHIKKGGEALLAGSGVCGLAKIKEKERGGRPWRVKFGVIWPSLNGYLLWFFLLCPHL